MTQNNTNQNNTNQNNMNQTNKIQNEKAIIVGVNLNNRKDFNESMEELKNLADACQIQVVGRVEQNLRNPHTKYYVGTGKLEEIKMECDDQEATMVIFNHELSPSQLRNLEKTLNTKIVDRTNLILEIFEKRAKTRESKLQVEVAHLKYLLPRLVGSYEALGRQSGGVGTKNKGVGEKKLELDRRRVEEQIHELSVELERLTIERETQRKRRSISEIPSIAMVGYTNSGKSTLMNAMLDHYMKNDQKKVFEKDMLFATLETSVRQIKLDDNKRFVLSDTVGFVSELPHDLVKAFRSTLDEVRHADLLLHVVDCSNENFENQIKVTLETIESLDAQSIPMIYVFNKIDRIKGDDRFDTLKEQLTKRFVRENRKMVMISAKTHEGLQDLVMSIKEEAFSSYKQCSLDIPYSDGKTFAYINENAHILHSEYDETTIHLDVECSERDYERLKPFIV